jgi:hypothetical protein
MVYSGPAIPNRTATVRSTNVSTNNRIAQSAGKHKPNYANGILSQRYGRHPIGRGDVLTFQVVCQSVGLSVKIELNSTACSLAGTDEVIDFADALERYAAELKRAVTEMSPPTQLHH